MVQDQGRVPSGALPDIIYPVRSGENEELRYSLRSLYTNARGLFRKVFVAGSDLPEWLTGVEVVRAGSPGGKSADIVAKVYAAAKASRVSRVVVFNDDHFVTRPIESWEAFHMGPTSQYLRVLAREGQTPENSAWMRRVKATAEWMAEQGHGDILVRQGHRPLLWDRRKLVAAIKAYPAGRPLDYPGLYDIAGAAGEGRRAGNAKIGSDPAQFARRLAKLDQPYLSTNDKSFKDGLPGVYIRTLFPDPSPYER